MGYDFDLEKAIERANKFWKEQEERVLRIAKENGITIEVEDFNGYLFDLFENGDADLTDAEVLERILEDL